VYAYPMMNVVYKVLVEEVAEDDLAALKESISDHILQEYPDATVQVLEEARVES